MSGYLIDLFFSFKGRASRSEWLVGASVLAVLAVGGLLLFNDASFDESIHQTPGAPTMAAFLWVLLCGYAFAALSAKRLRDCGRPLWLILTVAVPGVLVLLGWGLGLFPSLLAIAPETLAAWAMLVLMLPALLSCVALPTKGGG
ncbi:DUF805 domain-containing protein [Hyphomicrobium sp.]|uniref:DUF805 domain-containing protein n=1 Tax=Hyphomicrobium sp. TaxID=82 RepID=UPI0025C27135|nr:DUF805 domain-containing protein [Hyphomicrobium sp.]MCC7253863.1 DUF805 domain-containing protein [Hyphomicrobium sp.]